MKKLIAIFAVLALALVPVLAFSATDYESVCTPNGCSQGTLIRALYNLQVGLNDVITNTLNNAAVAELKTDHDTDRAGIITDLKTAENNTITRRNSSLVQIGTIVLSATPEKFKTTTTAIGVIRGATVSKAATDNLVFTAADTVNVGTAAGIKYGAWRVEVGLDGTVYTHRVSADQVYTSSAFAIAAVPAVTSGRYSLGVIVVAAKDGAAWTANTGDMTNGSDCQTATFTDDSAIADSALVSSSPAAALTAAVVTGTVVGATSYGTGTEADPRIQLND